MKRRYLWIIGAVLVVVGLVLWLSTRPKLASHEEQKKTSEEQEKDRAEQPDRLELSEGALTSLKLSYARVEERELSPSLEVPAELVPVPDRHATVGSRVAGRVVEVKVNIGDRVKAGASLLVLESDEVGRARADLIAATARADVARRAADRARKLLEDRVSSQRAVEEAEGALRIAEADLQAARTRLLTFGVVPDGAAGRNPAQVVLTSPLSGTVVARSVHIGQWVQPSEKLIEVVDLDALWLLASVYEREMRYVQTGQPVQVEVRASPGEVFTGTIAYVSNTLDERTRSVTVRVVLPNPGHKLRPGMFATARIQGTHEHEAKRLLAVPWSAIQEVDGHHAVFVHKEERVFELRRVHTGERAGDLVEVLNGLSSGEEVVKEGSFLLKGQLLRSSLGEKE